MWQKSGMKKKVKVTNPAELHGSVTKALHYGEWMFERGLVAMCLNECVLINVPWWQNKVTAKAAAGWPLQRKYWWSAQYLCGGEEDKHPLIRPILPLSHLKRNGCNNTFWSCPEEPVWSSGNQTNQLCSDTVETVNADAWTSKTDIDLQLYVYCMSYLRDRQHVAVDNLRDFLVEMKSQG